MREQLAFLHGWEDWSMEHTGNAIVRFMYLLDRLKAESGDSPDRLKVFYDQKETLKVAADELFRFVGWGSFERNVFHKSGKLLAGAPPGFEKAWKEYQTTWSSPLWDAVLKFDFDLNDLLPVDHTADEDIDTAAGDQDLERPDPTEESSFDPLRMDGAEALEMAFWAANSRAANIGDDYESEMDRASNIGLEAYEYLRGTIGFSPEEVFQRWRSLPIFFIPGHIVAKHTPAEKGGLYELLDNAIRAYVFGATLASVAMCRATLELVLKRHYRLEYQYKDERGRTREEGLGQLIVLAEAKYDFIQSGKLKPLTEWANVVLHSSTRKSNTSVDEQFNLINFFKTIKFLIDRAPIR